MQAKTGKYVYLNGRMVTSAAASVPVHDRGFAYGDALIETMKLLRGQPVFFDEHLERLRHAMAAAGMEGSIEPMRLKNEAAMLVKANSVDRGRLRILVSRGAPSRPQGLDPEPGLTPTVLLTAENYSGYPPGLYHEGMKCITVAGNRGRYASMKTTNLMGTLLARREAQAAGAGEAIFTSGHGRMLEGSFTNLFFLHGERLLTAPETEAILPGVVRAKVLELAERLGMEIDLKAPKLEETEPLATAAFLTGSLIGVCPVSEIDGMHLRMHSLPVGRLAEELARLEVKPR
jgi:branched-subunit amino acid aminotransferase/4-amino-4-deoxychorismate lyase